VVFVPATTTTPPAQIAPALRQWQEVGQLATGLQEVRGLAVGPRGRVYVAGDQLVRVYNGKRQPERDLALPGPPRCLAVASDGRLYVGLADQVTVLSPTGERLTSWPVPGKRTFVTGIALSADRVFVADAGNRVVLQYTPEGKLLGAFGPGSGPAQGPALRIPSPHLDVAVSAAGLVWIANPGLHTVNAFRPDNTLVASWSQSAYDINGFCGCCNPTDLAVLPEGGIVTSEKGVPRVKVYSPGGQLQSVVAGPEAFRPETVGLDLAVEGAGTILVLDPSHRSVRFFTRKSSP
jgi:hypothetical protein